MKYIRLMLIMGMMHILLSGCAHQGERAAQLQLRPSASDLHADESEDDGPPHAFNITPDSPAPSDTLGTIDMNQALVLALMHNPDLAGFAHQVRSAEGRALQAGMVPNPEVEIEMEEISDAGFDDAVASFLLSQPIELGGKRKKRVQLAHLEAAAARWEYEMTRLDVAASTKKAFTEVIAAQEKVTLALEMILLSEQMVETVSERIDAGRDSPPPRSSGERRRAIWSRPGNIFPRYGAIQRPSSRMLRVIFLFSNLSLHSANCQPGCGKIRTSLAGTRSSNSRNIPCRWRRRCVFPIWR